MAHRDMRGAKAPAAINVIEDLSPFGLCSPRKEESWREAPERGKKQQPQQTCIEEKQKLRHSPLLGKPNNPQPSGLFAEGVRPSTSSTPGFLAASSRRPFGVRQCGKTSAVRHFADQFENLAEINFEENERYKSIFDRNFDVRRILTALELEAGKRILPGRTLLFLDEIQTCPRAITALRYFYEQMPELHVIAAGSLLEILLNSKRRKDKLNFPEGRVRSMFLYPLSFSEFLRGTGNEMLCDYMNRENEMPPSAHDRLLEIYRSFLVVGGMPEAVSAFLDTGSILESQKVHRDIVMNFMDDFQKYESPVPPDVLKRVFDFAAHHVCSQIKSSSALEGVGACIMDHTMTSVCALYMLRISSGIWRPG